MRIPTIIGNWKMNTTLQTGLELVNALAKDLNNVPDREVGVCPPFIYLAEIKKVIQSTNIKLGAQNMHWEAKGAFTAEISATMLKDIGCDYVIIGHSERRHIFSETDQMINKKIKAALNTQLTPVFCVGEQLEEREKGTTDQVLRQQVEKGLNELTAEQINNIIIAYEPVWAIGTGKTATPAQAQEAHLFVRNLISRLTDETVAQNVRILYGGSVKPDNAGELMIQPDVDGALVGGASLEAGSFSKIVKYEIN